MGVDQNKRNPALHYEARGLNFDFLKMFPVRRNVRPMTALSAMKLGFSVVTLQSWCPLNGMLP